MHEEENLTATTKGLGATDLLAPRGKELNQLEDTGIECPFHAVPINAVFLQLQSFCHEL